MSTQLKLHFPASLWARCGRVTKFCSVDISRSGQGHFHRLPFKGFGVCATDPYPSFLHILFLGDGKRWLGCRNGNHWVADWKWQLFLLFHSCSLITLPPPSPSPFSLFVPAQVSQLTNNKSWEPGLSSQTSQVQIPARLYDSGEIAFPF